MDPYNKQHQQQPMVPPPYTPTPMEGTQYGMGYPPSAGVGYPTQTGYPAQTPYNPYPVGTNASAPVPPVYTAQPQPTFYYTNAGGSGTAPAPGMTPQYGFTAAPAPTYYEPKPEDENTGANAAYANDITNALEFSEKSIRLAFIRKVYTLLSVQLAVTVGLIALFIYHEGIKEFTRNNVWFYVSVYVVFLVTLIMLACPCCCPCGDIRRKAPGNYICLTVFTLASGVLLGVISAQYDVEVVILAIGSTALITLGLTLFAFQTKWDFTRLNGSLFAILLVFMLFGIFMGALRAYFPVVRMVYAGIGVLIFSLYLVHDTQLMMGGKHKYALSPEEYIFATLNIYLDVIMIFMYLLQIFGSRN